MSAPEDIGETRDGRRVAVVTDSTTYLPRRLIDRWRIQPVSHGSGRGGCEDLRRCEWHVRRATLHSLIKRAGPGIRLSEHLDGDGALAFQHACRMGLEGIVAKRRDRP